MVIEMFWRWLQLVCKPPGKVTKKINSFNTDNCFEIINRCLSNVYHRMRQRIPNKYHFTNFGCYQGIENVCETKPFRNLRPLRNNIHTSNVHPGRTNVNSAPFTMRIIGRSGCLCSDGGNTLTLTLRRGPWLIINNKGIKR